MNPEDDESFQIYNCKNSKKNMEFKRKKKELLERFEMIYNKISVKMDNPFQDIKDGSQMQDLWSTMDDDRMVGLLHAFILLKPLIRSAIE